MDVQLWRASGVTEVKMEQTPCRQRGSVCKNNLSAYRQQHITCDISFFWGLEHAPAVPFFFQCILTSSMEQIDAISVNCCLPVIAEGDLQVQRKDFRCPRQIAVASKPYLWACRGISRPAWAQGPELPFSASPSNISWMCRWRSPPSPATLRQRPEFMCAPSQTLFPFPPFISAAPFLYFLALFFLCLSFEDNRKRGFSSSISVLRWWISVPVIL